MIKYARVTSVVGETYKVTFLGEEAETPITYPKIGVYTPSIGDVVAFIKDELGKYFCLGSVKAYGSSGDGLGWGDITGKPDKFPPDTHYHKKSEINDFPLAMPADGGNADTAKNADKLGGKAPHEYVEKGQSIVVTQYSPDAHGQFRVALGDYGFFIRNDGANTYFMLTNKGDVFGGWNELRPIIINNSTGDVLIQGVSVVSKLQELENKMNQLKGENKRVFTANTSFTVPTGVNKIYVTACGGGSGGVGAGRYSNGGGSGGNGGLGGGGGTSGGHLTSGGGGAAIYRKAYTVTPGQVINITIGKGGKGSTDLLGSGNGGSTVLSGLVTLAGGTGRYSGGEGGGNSGSGAGGVGGTGISGNGGTGDNNVNYGSSGGGGSLGGGGGGGQSNYGTAGRGGTCSPLALYDFKNGTAGTTPDGIARGGDGGNGIVVIEFI